MASATLGIALLMSLNPVSAAADDRPIGGQGGITCDDSLGAHQPFYPGQSASQTYDQTFSQLGTERLPDLGEAEGDLSWIPQGLAYWTDWDGSGDDLLLVTAYRKDGGSSQIHGINAATGEHEGSVLIAPTHAGGIVVLGDYAYVSEKGSKKVRHYYLPALRNELKSPPTPPPFLHERGEPTTIGGGVAFLGTDGSRLYAGRYSKKATTRAVMESYQRDSMGQLTRDDDPSYVVPQRTQGMTVVDDDFFFSTSPTPESETTGRRSYIYRVSRADMKLNRPDDDVQLPPYGFTKASECFRAPSMSEGMVTHGDKSYLIFESGAAEYAFAKDNPPENPIRFVHVGRLGSGDGGGGGPQPGSSTTTYTGPTEADYHDSFTASARLAGSGPVSGARLSFTLGNGGGAQTCGATTNSAGVARCSLRPTQAPGTTTLTARFGGTAELKPSSDTTVFTITRQETALTHAGPERIANGTPATLSGVLTEESAEGNAVGDRSITMALGRGDERQACTGTTDGDGKARCTIESVNQPLNDDATVPATLRFDGDPYYQPSGKQATVLLEHYTGRSYGIAAELGVPGLGVDPTPDTGEVRTAQASRHEPGCAAIDTLLLRTGTLCPTVVTRLAPGTSEATSAVQDTRIGLPELPVIEVEAATARSTSTCASGGSARGTTDVRLRVGGKLIELTGEANVDVDLPGVARLVVNEQLPVSDAEHGRTVNAVHLVAANGTIDIVVGSATSAVHNCAS